MDWRFACYDVSDDKGFLLKTLYPDASRLPRFVKTASYPVRGTPISDWAFVYEDDEVSMRKFAMVDRGNVWTSTVYFTRTNGNLPQALRADVAHKLKLACRNFGLEAPDILGSIANGDSVQYATPTQVRPVHEKLADIREAIIRKDRPSPALDIDGMSPEDRHAYLEKTADDYGKIDKASLITGLMQRLQNVPSENRVAVYEEFSKLAMDPHTLPQKLEEFDARTGLIACWGRISDPYETVFGKEKVAAISENASPRQTYLGSALFTEDELNEFAESNKLKDAFPEGFIRQFRENPFVVFKSLPAPTQKHIAKLMGKKV